jgi:hypothetical protein
MLTSELVLYMHKITGGWDLLKTGLTLIIYTMFTWWRDVVLEATLEDTHTVGCSKRV